jgi:hypothetical protein
VEAPLDRNGGDRGQEGLDVHLRVHGVRRHHVGGAVAVHIPERRERLVGTMVRVPTHGTQRRFEKTKTNFFFKTRNFNDWPKTFTRVFYLSKENSLEVKKKN